jgi:potassium efflux system protein
MLRAVKGTSDVAATVRAFLLAAYPVVASAVILLFVLASLRYHVAAGFFRGVFLQAAAVIAVAYIVYRVLMGRLLGKRDFERRVRREEFDNPQEYMAAGRKLAIDLAARAAVRLAVTIPALFFLAGIWHDVMTAAFPELTYGQVAAGAANAGAQARGGAAASLGPAWFRTLSDLFWAVLAGWVTVVILRHFRRVMRYIVLPSTKLDTGIQYAILTLTSYVLLAMGMVITLRALNVGADQVGWFIAPLGVGIGFGLQDIVKGFVAGIVLLIERPVRVGDSVTVAGQAGVIDKINLRSTTLMNGDNVGIIIPNEQMVNGVLENRDAGTAFVRTSFPLGISYDADVKVAMKLMLEVLESHGLVRKKPAPEVYFVGFGASSLDFECRFWARVNDNRGRIASDLRSMILAQFRKNGIEIPFPQTDLHLRSVSDEFIRKQGLLRLGSANGETAAGGANGANAAGEAAPAGERQETHARGASGAEMPLPG